MQNFHQNKSNCNIKYKIQLAVSCQHYEYIINQIFLSFSPLCQKSNFIIKIIAYMLHLPQTILPDMSQFKTLSLLLSVFFLLYFLSLLNHIFAPLCPCFIFSLPHFSFSLFLSLSLCLSFFYLCLRDSNSLLPL